MYSIGLIRLGISAFHLIFKGSRRTTPYSSLSGYPYPKGTPTLLTRFEHTISVLTYTIFDDLVYESPI